jgi:hypothetical protein
MVDVDGGEVRVIGMIEDLTQAIVLIKQSTHRLLAAPAHDYPVASR